MNVPESLLAQAAEFLRSNVSGDPNSRILRLAEQSCIAFGENLVAWTGLFERFPRGHLSVGLPTPNFSSSPYRALFWFPSGIPNGQSHFVASSRLGKSLDRHGDWFRALRTLAGRLDHHGFLITADKTTAHRFVCRAGECYDRPVIQFHILDRRIHRKSKKTIWNLPSPQGQLDHCRVIPLGSQDHIERDQLLTGIAKQVRVLYARANGKVFHAVLGRCVQQPNDGPVFLLRNPRTSNSAQTQLEDAGCIPWQLVSTTRNPSGVIPPFSPAPMGSAPLGSVPFISKLPPGQFLLHTTRARSGPWPDQTESQFIDSLIFQESALDFSATAVLQRIRQMQMILGTSRLTRHSHPVVCFTAATPEQLLEMRTFRPHLSRWDFEPLGIAIRLRAAKELKAKPVIYGDEQTWHALTDSQRPFFQVSSSTSAAGNKTHWEHENEWRIMGDVDLATIPPGDIFAFNLTPEQ